ncbi:MTP-1 family protein [Paenibacillus glycanilyticus]|uniref:MTP-1 family protein n=1 Tax=Paenibacillus glycanilyticus TaxID=126569 RepID=UPI003EBA17F5
MNLLEQRRLFEDNKQIYESAKLIFRGIDGFDVYNPSIPFEWQGKRYIYGRVEKRQEWARSWVRLFEQSGPDEWTLVPDTMIYQLEDPYVSIVNEQLVLGGTHVRYNQGRLDTFYGYFYKGTDVHDLLYFTTGPDYMKDIRLVQLPGSKIGVFSRPRSEEVRQKYGSESLIGFTVINSLDELSSSAIENAPHIPGLFQKDEWGGCNQAYLLESGRIGVIGHICYKAADSRNQEIWTYMNMSFVLDPQTNQFTNLKIIGTRPCYPEGPAKKPNLTDCAFTAGIEMRPDGKVNLYSGIGDTESGRIAIDYPFEGEGAIVSFRIK